MKLGNPLNCLLLQYGNKCFPRYRQLMIFFFKWGYCLRVGWEIGVRNARGVRTANTGNQIMYFQFENRRLFSIEFQLHTNSHITLWLSVLRRVENAECRKCSVWKIRSVENGLHPAFSTTCTPHLPPNLF